MYAINYIKYQQKKKKALHKATGEKKSDIAII